MTGWVLVCITLIRVGSAFQFTEQEIPQPTQAICEKVGSNWIQSSKASDVKVKGGHISYSIRCEYRR